MSTLLAIQLRIGFLLFICGPMTGQDRLTYTSNTGLTAIEYTIETDKPHSDQIKIISKSSRGIAEHKFIKEQVALTYETSPPFITLKCKEGACIEAIEPSAASINNKEAISLLLTYDEAFNRQLRDQMNHWIGSESESRTEISREVSISSTTKWIPLRPLRSGVYGINVAINDVITKDFILDSGASTMSMSMATYQVLKSDGVIDAFDIIGPVKSVIADGSVVQNTMINLKKIVVGEFTFHNVQCLVSMSTAAPHLLGQNILRSFGTISINYDEHRMYIID